MPRWPWGTVRSNGPRYPRCGLMRPVLVALLMGWRLDGVCAGAIALHLLAALGRGPSSLVDRSRALESVAPLPPFSIDPAGALVALLLVVLLFALLAKGGLWALRGIRAARSTMLGRDIQRVADYRARERDEIAGGERVAVPSLRIIALQGGAAARREPILYDIVTVGRDATNTIVLPDPRVSRKQLRVSKELYYWRVDATPRAATLYINGVARTNAILRAHDQLVCGATILRFDAPACAASTVVAEQVPALVVTCAALSFTAPLRGNTMTLGRAPDCGIVVPSKVVSRHHAELVQTSDATYEIRDIDSRNGLLFDGHRVPAHTFRHGDVVTIGARADAELVMLRYLVPGAQAQITAGFEDTDAASLFETMREDGSGALPSTPVAYD